MLDLGNSVEKLPTDETNAIVMFILSCYFGSPLEGGISLIRLIHWVGPFPGHQREEVS